MKLSKALLLTALTLVSAEKLEYVGVNESCGEFGEGELPGIYNKHYIYPSIDSIKTTIEQGMNVFRINFRWERFQHELFGEFNEFDITEYKKVVDATTAEGATVILDPHNYARYNNNLIGSEEVPIEAFVDFWTKLAEIFKDNEKVWFGLVNEPHDMETDDWFKAARAAVDGIRATGAKNNILIPGNGWTGAWSWGKEAWYGEANADVALRYFSSEDENILFEVHQYFDSDYSGSKATCVQVPCQNNFKEFVEWLKTNNLKGWVGEIGGLADSQCKSCIEEVIEYLQENRDVIKGVQWWAAGPWWGHNVLSIEPNAEKAFPEQMAWLKPYLPGPSELTEVPTFVNEKVYCKGCEVTGTGGDGSFWGWEDEKSCEIDKETCGYNNDDGSVDTPVDTPAVEKIYCKGCEVTGTGGDGSLWGWEDEKSCEIDITTCKIGNNATDDNINNGEKLEYVGVNESCGEFGEGELPGIYNKHYIYPNIDSIKTTIEQGMNVFRINFRWERFQHELFGEFNEFDITEYKKVVDATTAEGATVILDPHNYARYNNNLIGSEEVPIEAFVDFWTKLAEIFKDNEKVWFGLVNEPHDMETDDWFKAARAAVDGIRATGAKNNILIPGNGWTGAWSWGKEAWYGEANADVALRYFSSEDENILFEVHQYFDSDYSGSKATCVQVPCQNNFKEFVEWLKTNNLKGWVGEIGGLADSQCKSCIEEVIEYLQENRDVIKGVQWWAAGPWWGHNVLSIEPNAEKAFPEQMAWLKPYLPGPSELTEVPTFVNEKVYCKGCEVTGTGGDGSFWGWEDEKSCEIDKETCGYNNDDGSVDTPVDTPAVEKIYCKGCEVTGTGGDGSLWGWEDEKSCEIDITTCKIGNNATDDNINNGEKLEYVGVNESCGEFGEGELPGIYNKHYIYPNIDSIKTTIEQGMNVFRINFRWERFQHELFGEFNEFDITEYKKVVDATTAEGATVILDPHNYARYKNNLIGSEEVPIEAFVDFWTKLAEIFKDNEKVWFGLVNEPHDMETDDWFKIARAAVDGIRATGAKNNILIPGNGWTGAWSWGKEAWYGEANADVALRYFSSEDENILFEVHQYFDSDYSGSKATCVQVPCQNNFKEFVEWLKTNNLKGWVGEIGGLADSQCKSCIEEVIEYLQENRDVIKGVQWWAAGPWWGHNILSIEPNAEKAFPEQMAWLKPYLPGPSELTEVPTFVNEKVYCKGCEVTGTGGDGSFWGWEDEKSCEIDKETCGYNDNTPIENPPVVEKTYCKGCEVTGTGGDGSLWGWEDEKSCEIDVAACKIGEEPTEPSTEATCKFEALGYKCCSHCVSYLEDEDGLWGVENGEWCGISDECIKGYDECWSNKFGYPCCDTCDVFLTDESGDWGVKDLDWCGIPSTCKSN